LPERAISDEERDIRTHNEASARGPDSATARAAGVTDRGQR
jgi:hypothetical protein